MSISSQVARSGPFLITALPQTIPVGFPFQQGSDLLVLNIGTVASPKAAVTMVLGSDYTVTGGSYNTSIQMQVGSIVAVSGGTGGIAINDQLVIVRNVPINQASSLSPTEPLTVQIIEKALDKQATISQELAEDVTRCLRFPVGEFLDGSLPLALRKGRVIGFDSIGRTSFYDPATAAFVNGTGISVSNIATLKALSVTGTATGQQASVSGYYSSADGGGGLFVYNSASSATDNGGTVIAPNVGSGRWIRVVNTGGLNARWFGAAGDGTTDDTTALNNWLAAIVAVTPSGCSAYLPAGNYRITSQLTLGTETSAVHLFGDGFKQSTLFPDNATPFIALYVGSSTYKDFRIIIENIGLVQPTSSASGAIGIDVHNRGGVIVRQVAVDHGYLGLQFTGSFAPRIEYCLFTNTASSALKFASDGSANNAVVLGNGAFTCGATASSYAFDVPQGEATLLQGNDIESSYGGIKITLAAAYALIGNYIEVSGAGGNVFFATSNTGVVMEGNFFGASSATTWSNVRGLTVRNNTFYNWSVTCDGTTQDVTLGTNNLVGSATFPDPPYTEFDYINNWGAGASRSQYKKLDNGVVLLRGEATLGAGSNNNPISNPIAARYRPSVDQTFIAVDTNGVICYVVVSATGNVIPHTTGGPAGVWLNGISWTTTN